MRLITNGLIIIAISLLLSGCDIEAVCGASKTGEGLSDCFDDDADEPIAEVNPEELRANLRRFAENLTKKVQNNTDEKLSINVSEVNDSPTTTNESTESDDSSPIMQFQRLKRRASEWIPVQMTTTLRQRAATDPLAGHEHGRQGVLRDDKLAYSFVPESQSGSSLLAAKYGELSGTLVVAPQADSDIEEYEPAYEQMNIAVGDVDCFFDMDEDNI